MTEQLPARSGIVDKMNVIVISGVCILAIVLHLTITKFDAVAVALVLLGLSPWMTDILESVTFGANSVKFRVKKNEDSIAALEFLVAHVLTEQELKWLLLLHQNQPVITDTSPEKEAYYQGWKSEMGRLLGLGFIKQKLGHFPGSVFRHIESKPKGVHDGRDYFEVTQAGADFLTLLARSRPNELGRLSQTS
jgi:hypothetical protein